ncbi:hypothetical protein FQZ97_1202590 [compost metagenome]
MQRRAVGKKHQLRLFELEAQKRFLIENVGGFNHDGFSRRIGLCGSVGQFHYTWVAEMNGAEEIGGRQSTLLYLPDNAFVVGNILCVFS